MWGDLRKRAPRGHRQQHANASIPTSNLALQCHTRTRDLHVFAAEHAACTGRKTLSLSLSFLSCGSVIFWKLLARQRTNHTTTSHSLSHSRGPYPASLPPAAWRGQPKPGEHRPHSLLLRVCMGVRCNCWCNDDDDEKVTSRTPLPLPPRPAHLRTVSSSSPCRRSHSSAHRSSRQGADFSQGFNKGLS
jgi:hypothetical protein